MAWLVLFYKKILNGDARSRNFLMSGSIFILLLYAEKNHLNIATFSFCRRRESNPGCQHSKRARYPLHHCPSARLEWQLWSLINSPVFINHPGLISSAGLIDSSRKTTTEQSRLPSPYHTLQWEFLSLSRSPIQGIVFLTMISFS